MIGNLIGIILLTPTVLAQFDLKPDVSFTDTNDRFDLTGMMQAHPAFRDAPLIDDNDDDIESDEDFRRSLNVDQPQDIDVLKKKNPEANIEETFLTRKSDGGFAYDDRMDSNEGGTISDFVESLKGFEHNVEPPNRRRRDVARTAHKRFRRNADQYVLSQYGFPILMKVDGYLKPPLE
ncbi:unnamed protein product [Spodoptera littoralis]|uniref:Uncharacterized protein n=1 Tax=Spodoptera littoralis TaxID=7109 RepID=A0A9P0I8R2_SPOLI|nr:unnamed protein product [Spodoptera littoralis]